MKDELDSYYVKKQQRADEVVPYLAYMFAFGLFVAVAVAIYTWIVN